MLDRPSLLTPERVASVNVGLAGAFTSSLLLSWATLSLPARVYVFVASWVCASLLARWAGDASTELRALGRSLVAGGVQANVSASYLLVVATLLDGGTPDFAWVGIIATIGSFVGVVIGALYAVVPIIVAASRRTRSYATTDDVIFATGGWLAIVACGHASLVAGFGGNIEDGQSSFAPRALLHSTWMVPAVIALASFAVSHVRTTRRESFVRRVRAGTEPPYRIVPIEAAAGVDDALPLASGRSPSFALVRDALDRERESLYRDAAERREPPRAIALL